jgi:hypothetical protein
MTDALKRYGQAASDDLGRLGALLKKHGTPSQPTIEWTYLLGAVAIQFVIAGIIGAVLWAIARKHGYDLDVRLMFLIGLAIWTSVLFFNSIIDEFFVLVPPNHGAVFANRILRYESPTDGDLKLKNTRTMRETGSGIQGKLPFIERLFSNSGDGDGRMFINLQRRVPIGASITAYTKDYIPYKVTFSVFLTPLRGYLCNHVRYFDEDAATYFQAEFMGYLIRMIHSMTEDELQQSIGLDPDAPETHGFKHGKLEHGFNTLFGGAGVVTETEKQYGTFTGDPVISEVVVDPDFKKTLAAEKQAQKFNTAVNVMVSGTHINHDLAAMIAASMAGHDVPITGIRVFGLEGMTYFSGSIPELNLKESPTRKAKK